MRACNLAVSKMSHMPEYSACTYCPSCTQIVTLYEVSIAQVMAALSISWKTGQHSGVIFNCRKFQYVNSVGYR